MSFSCTFIVLEIKLISIWKVVCQDSFWNSGKRQLGNGLLHLQWHHFPEAPGSTWLLPDVLMAMNFFCSQQIFEMKEIDFVILLYSFGATCLELGSYEV